ncbi:MAG: HIT domain-containing protein [Pseudomonadales bacterium]
MADFALHERLAADCIHVGDLPLCCLLLMNDQQYPWFILVPRVNDIREAFQLSHDQQLQLNKESNSLSKAMASAYNADKMNVAALGNMVPQLHVHHIARFADDAAWPKPVWGVADAVAHSVESQSTMLSSLREQGIDCDINWI